MAFVPGISKTNSLKPKSARSKAVAGRKLGGPHKGDFKPNDPRIHKTGSLNKRSQEMVEQAMQRGVVPLVCMMDAIEHWRTRYLEAETQAKKDFYMREVQKACGEAAPYLHARLKHIEQDLNHNDVSRMTPEQLIARLAEFGVDLPQWAKDGFGDGTKRPN